MTRWASACEWPGAAVRRHRDLSLAVQPVDRGRPRALIERDEVPQLHELAARGPDGGRGQRLGRAAERVLRLQHDVVLIAGRVEGGDALPGHQRVDGLRHVFDANAEIGRALAIDHDPQLGRPGT